MSKNKGEIIKNNNSTEETKEYIKIQQNKTANKKKINQNINKVDSTKILLTEDNSNNNNNNNIINNTDNNTNNKAITENNTNNEEKTKNKTKEKAKSKTKPNKTNIKLVIKEQNELLTKEREYLKKVENLKLKIKNLEESYQDEEEKITSENTERQNRIIILTSTNERMKQSYEVLSQRMNQLQTNMTKKVETPKNNPNEKEKENSKEKIITEKNKELKKKQNLINILSKENQDMKKSIDRFYELDVNKNITKEVKDKEQLKIKIEDEIAQYEEIVKQHNEECSKTIESLKKDLKDIESKLKPINNKYHDKNKDCFYMKSKLSLSNKEKEEEYKKLKNKKNFLNMEKHNYLLNLNEINNKKSFNLQMYNKKKEFSRDLVMGVNKKYERCVSLPKIDINSEKKVISSLFTEKELINLQKIFMDEYQDEEMYNNFKKKINDLEKGNFIEEPAFDELNEECEELENQIKENKELLSIENMKLNKLKNENFELNQNYKNLYRKNIVLKREEKKLKIDLEEKNKKELLKIKREKQKQEVEKMLKDINKIYLTEQDNSRKKSYPQKVSNKEQNTDENEDNINNNENGEETNNFYENGEEYEEQNYNGEEGEAEVEGEEEGEGEAEEENNGEEY